MEKMRLYGIGTTRNYEDALRLFAQSQQAGNEYAEQALRTARPVSYTHLGGITASKASGADAITFSSKDLIPAADWQAFLRTLEYTVYDDEATLYLSLIHI